MKIKRYSGKEQQQILVGLITDPVFCSRMSSIWNFDEKHFEDSDYEMTAGWCIRFFRKYGKVPNKQLRALFQKWSSLKATSEKRAEIVEKKLIQLDRSRKKQALDTEVLIEIAEEYINRVRFEDEYERGQYDLERGSSQKLIARMQSFQTLRLSDDGVIKPGEQFAPWRDAFEQSSQKPLINYPSDLDQFLGPVMARDAFVAFMAPDKSFKSVYLLDSSFRGIESRRRVAFFEAGDLSQNQVMYRLALRTVGRPRQRGTWLEPRSVNASGAVQTRRRSADTTLGIGAAYRAFQAASEGDDRFRLRCYSNGTLSARQIESVLTDYRREGWTPDIVVIDYADIMAPPDGVRDTLDQIDENWKHLRRISQDFNCLVLTATQSSAAAYNKKTPTLNRSHFSGRKTKLAHVTAMIGINVTDGWRERGVSGLNFVVRREGQWTENKMKIVAGCIEIMNPILAVSQDTDRSFRN
jgi:hypothetical protein